MAATLELEVETRQNTRDIAQLANTVTRLATLVEGSQKRDDEDRQNIREVFAGIKALNEKMGGVAGMQEAISALREELRVARHDLNSVMNGLNGIAILQEKINEAKSDYTEKINDIKTEAALITGRVKAIEDRNQRIDGGVKVVERISGWMWAVAGGALMLIVNNWAMIRGFLSAGGGGGVGPSAE